MNIDKIREISAYYDSKRPEKLVESKTKKRARLRREKRMAKREGKKIIAKFNPQQKFTYRPFMGSEFYQTSEWRKLRWMALENSNGKCVVCGRSPKEHGVILHVDHKHPRSKYPLLELELSNLQVLCADCNLGKGTRIQAF